MTIQTFFKGLFMALVAVLVAGFSTTPIDYALMAVTAIATVLAFTGHNLVSVLNQGSPAGTFNWIDFAATLLVAVSTGIMESIALIVTAGHIEWPMLLKVVGSVTLTFIGSTLFSPPKSQSKKLKLFKLAA